MIPSRRRLMEHLVPDETLEVVAYGQLVDDSVRDTVAIGLTDRRVLCLSPTGDLVDVDYASICTIRSFSHSRLTFEGVDSRLIAGLFGLLAGLFVVLAAFLALPSNPAGGTVYGAVLVFATVGATLLAIASHRRATRSARATEGTRVRPVRRVVRAYQHSRVRRCHWWCRGRLRGLSVWGIERVRRPYRWSVDRIRGLYWASTIRLARAASWGRRRSRRLSVWAGELVYPYRPRWRARLADGRSLCADWGQRAGLVRPYRTGVAAARSIGAGIATGGRLLGRAGRASLTGGGRALRAGRSRIRLPRFGRLAPFRRSLSTVSRPSYLTGRRLLSLVAGAVAVGSFVAILLNGSGVTVAALVALSLVSLGLALSAYRTPTDYTGVEFSRQQERELTIQTVDGDTVRFVLDHGTELDTELSRLAAQVPQASGEPSVPDVVTG